MWEIGGGYWRVPTFLQALPQVDPNFQNHGVKAVRLKELTLIRILLVVLI